jgi:hypothetical protein
MPQPDAEQLQRIALLLIFITPNIGQANLDAMAKGRPFLLVISRMCCPTR